MLFFVPVFFPGEFQAFAMTHPEYAKLFTTYLELQRYQAMQEARPGDLELSSQASSGEKQQDSVSDKKDDWHWRMTVNSLWLHWKAEHCIHWPEKEILKASAALQRFLAKSSHLPQQSHVMGYVLAFFIDGF